MQARTDSDQSTVKLKRTETRAHVLLVEDNAINQRILKRKLEAKKFKVTTANNGREAVNTVKENLHVDDSAAETPTDHFDVILMDQEMPVLDGNAATKEIRQLEKDGEIVTIPILGVTANVREPQKDEMRSAGMNDVISKPYSMEDLIGRIEGLVVSNAEGQRSEVSHAEADGG